VIEFEASVVSPVTNVNASVCYKICTFLHKIVDRASQQIKYFLKEISLKGDVNRCKNHKVPIFYEQLLCKRALELLQIILQICLRSFVNFHPVL